MKKLTIVLTAAALAASVSCSLKPSEAQSPTPAAPPLSSLTAKGYDPTLASNALASNTDAAALLAQINASRRANGLPLLAADPSLGAAAMYQETCQVKWRYSGNYGILGEGASAVYPAPMATDFGSAATSVASDAFGNGFFVGDTDNWPALMADWQKSDTVFNGILNNANINVAGLYMVDTGALSGTTHIYKWVLYVGYKAPTAAADATPTLAGLTAKGYDPTFASNALLSNSDAATLLAQINASRRANGLPLLAADPSLGAAAMYQETCQVKWRYSGNYGILGEGASAVYPASMATDFGSAATSVASDAFGNGFFVGDTDNWPALMADWQKSDTVFNGILNNANINVAGLYMVDTGALSGTTHIYKWVLYVGYNPNAVTTTTTTGPTITLTGLNPTLAQQALTATPSASETAFLASINAYRNTIGLQSLVMQPALYATAYYDTHSGQTGSVSALASDFGSLYSTLDAVNGTNNMLNGAALSLYGNWPDMYTYWRFTSSTFALLLGDNSYGHCGLSIVDTGTTAKSSATSPAYEVYNWVIIGGK